MKATIIGFRNYSFTSEKDGRLVEGTTLHMAKEKYGVTGKEGFKASISRTLAERCNFIPVVGTDVEVEYDDRGKITGIYND